MQLYRQALAILFGDPLPAPNPAPSPRLTKCILEHGLAPLWHARTGHPGLRDARHGVAARYLQQRSAMEEVGATLDAAGIAHAFFKGTAIRELFWPDPAFRSADDIDLLVAPEDRDRVLRVLSGAGFDHRPTPAQTHETSLARDGIEIDLHWGIHRPGHFRIPMQSGVVARRTRVTGVWTACPEDCFCLALVITAFGDYATASTAGLHRMADLLFMMERQPPDWNELRQSLTSHGARTGAWCTLRALSLVAPDRFGEMIAAGLHALRPGFVHRGYLGAWIAADLPARLGRHHWVRQAAFSLAMHDSLGDAWRAMRHKLAPPQNTSGDGRQDLS